MGVVHLLQAVFLVQAHDQSLRICHIQAEGVLSPSAKAAEEDHKRSAEVCSAWGCSYRKWAKGHEARTMVLTVLAGNPGPLDKIRSGTADKPLFGRVFADRLDL